MNNSNFKIATKQHKLIAITMYTTSLPLQCIQYLYPGWVTLPSLGNLTQDGKPYPGWLNIIINIFINHTRDILRPLPQKKMFVQPKQITLSVLCLLWIFSMSVHIYSAIIQLPPPCSLTCAGDGPKSSGESCQDWDTLRGVNNCC